MAQFFRNFQSDTTDSAPAGLTERWVTTSHTPTVRASGIPSGADYAKALEIVGTGSAARYGLTLDEVGSPSGDVEILIKLLHQHTSNAAVLRPMLHASGASGAESRYYVQPSSGVVAILKTIGGGSNTAVSGSSILAVDRNIWYRMRLQRTGTTIRVRIWEDGDPEPGTWTVSATDSDLSGGWVGLAPDLTALTGKVWVDWIGVGTGGDAAPDAPLTTTHEAAFDVTLGLGIDADPVATSTAAFDLTLGLGLDVEAAILRRVAFDIVLGLGITASVQTARAAAFDILLGLGIDASPKAVKQAALDIVLGLGLDAAPQIVRQVAFDIALGLGLDIALEGEVSPAFDIVLGLGIDAQLDITRTPAFDIVLGLGIDTAVRVTSFSAFDLLLGLDIGVRYTGPGTGVIVTSNRDQRREQAIRALQAGDSRRVLIPHGGEAGITGLARALSRTVNDADGGFPRIEPALAEDADESLALARRTAGQTTRPTTRPGIKRAIGGR